MAKGKGKMPSIKTVNSKTKADKPYDGGGSVSVGDNPYGGASGDPTAKKGGH